MCRPSSSRFGSSPRPWGTPRPAPIAAPHGRFIPTPVGNAAPACSGAPAAAVHPHARGERGAACDQLHRALRFIPTPVGNAVMSADAARSASVHPHARGERRPAVDDPSLALGSSPRPWGTRALALGQRLQFRFIPTPVGNATGSRRCSLPRPVHPHARGERPVPLTGMDVAPGSSPRPWGTPAPRHHGADRTSVHPHARGERYFRGGSSLSSAGSSPRPWGTQIISQTATKIFRFIPTPVGNAACPGARRRADSVHPHARGERLLLVTFINPFFGSSPRPWGTRRHLLCADRAVRFIPTPVGNARP